MIIKYTNYVTHDFEFLSDELNKELQDLFGKAQDKYKQYNLLSDIKDFFICYYENKPVGCGSIKIYKNGIYEIKRVFVLKEYRGLGISKKIMNEIENKAKEKGIRKLILETGEALIAAMNLYTKLGYKRIENYGQYINMNESICLEKELYY